MFKVSYVSLGSIHLQENKMIGLKVWSEVSLYYKVPTENHNISVKLIFDRTSQYYSTIIELNYSVST